MSQPKIGKYFNIVFYKVYNKIRMRTFAKPFDPQTAAQLKHRGKIRFLTKIIHQGNNLFIKQFWNFFDPFNIGSNSFQTINLKEIEKEEDYENLKTTIGILEPVFNIDFIKYKDVNGRCMFKWKDTIINNGLPTDKIFLCLIYYKYYSPVNNYFELSIFVDFSKTRQDSIGFIKPAKELDTNFMYGYISTFREPINSISQISNSKSKKVIAF